MKHNAKMLHLLKSFLSLLLGHTILQYYYRSFTICLFGNRKLADGLFIKCCEEVAQFYPKIKFDTMIIDNCCMQVGQIFGI